MALLSAQQISIPGLTPSYSAPAAGSPGSDTAVPDERSFWHVKVGATATTVTVVVPGSQYGQARPDVVLSGLTSTERMIGPLVQDLADPATGLITLQTSQQTGVTAALVRV
jgi:hypothetical protein